jgi:hypothetical protein
MCHASERAEQIVRLDVVPKDAGRDPTGDQRLDGQVQAVRCLAVVGFRSTDQGIHCPCTGRKSGADMARLCSVSQPTMSRKNKHAQTIATHSSPRTTKLYDRRNDEIAFDEVEKIAI